MTIATAPDSGPGMLRWHVIRAVVLAGIVWACLTPPIAADSGDLEDLVAYHGRSRLLGGNRVELLDDGPIAFERRLELVDSASHHLLISTFIWRRDEYGLRMLDAITRRIQEVEAQDGTLEVLVILDDTTPQASNDWWSTVRRRLEKAGASVRHFNPPRWGLLPIYGARLHDKIMIADGRTAIFGGRNISNHYFAADGHRFWYDADVLLEGPSVTDLQMHWLKMWVVLKRLRRMDRFLAPPERALGEVQSFWRTGSFPDGDRPLDAFATRAWFPDVRDSGDLNAAILYDNPLVWELAPTHEVVRELVDRAQREIDIITPFPNITNELMTAIRNAVDRGVRVRLVTNSRKRAIRTGVYWKTLLPSLLELTETGVETWGWIGETNGADLERCNSKTEPFSGLHAKMLQVDGDVAIITASNFNVRSSWFNTEAGLLIQDPQFATAIRDQVDTMTGSKPFTLQCEDGSLLELERPASPFDEAEQERMRTEVGNATRRIEAYGPMF